MLKNIIRYCGTLYSLSYLNSIFSVFLLAVLVRTLSVDDLGKYALFGLYLSLFQVFFGYGLFRTTVKFVGEGKENVVAILSLLGFFIGLLIILLILSSLLLFHFAQDYMLIAILMTTPNIALQLIASFFRGKFLYKHEAVLVSARGFLTVFATFIFLGLYKYFYNFESLEFLVNLFSKKLYLIPIAGQCVSLFFLFFVYSLYIYKNFIKHNISKITFAEFKELAKKFLRFGFPLWIANNCSRINDMLDQFAVKHLVGITALGEYFLAINLFAIVEKPISIISRVFLSAFSRAEFRNRDTYGRVVSANLAIFPTLSLCIVSVAPALSSLLFSKAYDNVAFLFAIMSFSYIFQSIELINSIITVTENRPQINRNAHLATLVTNVPILYALVSSFSVFGAATSKGIQRGIYFLYLILFMRKDFPWHVRQSLRKGLTALGLYAVMFTYIYCTEFGLFSFLSVFFYLAGGHILKVFDLADLFRTVQKSILPAK